MQRRRLNALLSASVALLGLRGEGCDIDQRCQKWRFTLRPTRRSPEALKSSFEFAFSQFTAQAFDQDLTAFLSKKGGSAAGVRSYRLPKNGQWN